MEVDGEEDHGVDIIVNHLREKERKKELPGGEVNNIEVWTTS